MLVQQQAVVDVDDVVVDSVPIDDVAVDGIPATDTDPTPPSPPPTTTPPSPQELPSTSQVIPTLPPSPIAPPSSPPQQQPPSQPTTISMDILNNLLETWIMVEEPKPLKKQAQIEQDEAYARELEMDYFKGMSYDDIRLIFEKYFNSNVDFLEKTKEQLEEEESRALKRNTESQAEKAAKKQKLDEEVEELRKHLQIVPNDEDDVYTEATPLTHKNFDREDLEGLWQLVKERFASSKPKNFLDDFMLTILSYMFEKPDVKAQVWKNPRTVHGLATVKS
nr:hypothetical protein [Tanacetum cinerariifolium]